MKGRTKVLFALLCSILIAGTPLGSMAADKIPTPPSILGITPGTVSPTSRLRRKKHLKEIHMSARFLEADSPKNWLQFWDSQAVFPDILLSRNMRIFVEKSNPHLDFSSTDHVLDIGCGPGHLAESLRGKVASYTGIDTSEKFLTECHKKFTDQKNFSFHALPLNYTNLEFLPANKFTKLVCLSVVQYYESINEVEQLIQHAKRVAVPGASLLIADLIVDTNWMDDVNMLFRTALREHIFWKTCAFLLKARFSSYYHIAESNGLLSFTKNELELLIARMDIDGQILGDAITLNPNRSHLLVRF